MRERTIEQILEDACRLPEMQRARLARELLDSLQAPAAGERSEAEWLAEIEERARAAVEGEPGLDWETVRAEIERSLRRG